MSITHSGAEQRRKPQQARGLETRNSILVAAGELFGEQGYEATTTHQIAARAQVSVGALYRYFADKEAILREVYDSEMANLRHRTLATFASIDLDGADVTQLVREALRQSFRIYSHRLRLHRVLGEQSRKIPELVELRQNLESEVHHAVQRILESTPGIAFNDVEVGAYLVSLFMESLIDDYVLYRKESTEFEEERIVDGAAEFIVQALLSRTKHRTTNDNIS